MLAGLPPVCVHVDNARLTARAPQVSSLQVRRPAHAAIERLPDLGPGERAAVAQVAQDRRLHRCLALRAVAESAQGGKAVRNRTRYFFGLCPAPVARPRTSTRDRFPIPLIVTDPFDCDRVSRIYPCVCPVSASGP